MPRQLIEETTSFKRYQVTDAQGKMIGEDVEPKLAPEQLTEQSLRSKASAALAANAAFLAKASPTNAEVVAQVKLLTRECNALIRLVLSQLDTDDA
jgi:hypothetical protein